MLNQCKPFWVWCSVMGWQKNISMYVRVNSSILPNGGGYMYLQEIQYLYPYSQHYRVSWFIGLFYRPLASGCKPFTTGTSHKMTALDGNCTQRGWNKTWARMVSLKKFTPHVSRLFYNWNSYSSNLYPCDLLMPGSTSRRSIVTFRSGQGFRPRDSEADLIDTIFLKYLEYIFGENSKFLRLTSVKSMEAW